MIFGLYFVLPFRLSCRNRVLISTNNGLEVNTNNGCQWSAIPQPRGTRVMTLGLQVREKVAGARLCRTPDPPRHYNTAGCSSGEWGEIPAVPPRPRSVISNHSYTAHHQHHGSSARSVALTWFLPVQRLTYSFYVGCYPPILGFKNKKRIKSCLDKTFCSG